MSDKTNAVRLIEKSGITHRIYEYDASDGQIDGVSVANKIGKSTNVVFKTLVTIGSSKVNYVFVVPVDKELDLKAAAKSVGEKSIEMFKPTELFKLTGYVKGGCSPVGMKKLFKTVVDESAASLPEIVVSAGKIGMQIELTPQDLVKEVNAEFHKISL